MCLYKQDINRAISRKKFFLKNYKYFALIDYFYSHKNEDTSHLHSALFAIYLCIHVTYSPNSLSNSVTHFNTIDI